MRFFAFLCAILALHSAAARSAEPGSCAAVAKLFDKPICREELKPQDVEFIKQLPTYDPAQQSPLEREIAKQNKKKLQDVIWHQALVKKFGAQAVDATDADIKVYTEKLNAQMTASYEADKKMIAYLKNMMQKRKFGLEDTQKMQNIIDTAEQGLKFYEEREKHTESLPEDYKFIINSIETEISRSMLSEWKQSKVLFEAYGGRLAAHDTSFLPFDAYAAFLEYIRKEGKLEILDLAYKDAMSEMEERIKDASGRLLIEDETMKKGYFSDAQWQLSLSNSDERLEQIKKWVESLPEGNAEKEKAE
ncbi:MAG: hypothetical protein HY370_05560 [Proteobacteria bacterium]|nr:hypothetical protein [Pseudomonadota bacterium]